MKKSRRMLMSSILVAGALGGSLALAAPASASTTASQTWDSSASYRASKDFVATSSEFVFGGTACSGGSASKYYVQLVKTSNSSKIKSSTSWSVGAWNYQYGSGTSSGTAYYMRWYGQNSSESNGYSAPCQGIVYSD